ncbi:long-chain fatty acid--CoA ligase [Ammoniphilus sp. 3BR4]|uniref:long-chain-fatty-acid--CoA ligase n=1 Tax=Ammoniphilus sp. 3BR4 TaxID=3158265 RepID=UPI003466FE3B
MADLSLTEEREKRMRGEQRVNRPWYAFYPEGIPHEIEVPPLSLYDLLKQSEQDYPEQIAVIDGEHQLTYSELKHRVDRLASSLYSLGLNKGNRIGVMLPNCVEYIIAYYAIQRLGGILVQVNPMYQQSELAYILNDSEAQWIICQEEQREKIRQIGLEDQIGLIFTDGESDSKAYDFYGLISSGGIDIPPLDINPKEDLAVLQYTGGTTGRSKGVMLTHFNLVSNVIQSFTFAGGAFERPGERLLSLSPYYHVYGMTSSMNITIYAAGTLICSRRFEVNQTLELIRMHQPTYFPGVPTMYIALFHHPDSDKAGMDCIKVCNSGSAPMPVEIMHEFERKTGARIVEGYGLSETSPVTHRNPIRGQRKAGSIGLPLPNTDSKVVDLETGTVELPPGEAGELIVKGPQVMKGYWKKPEETALTIRDGWLFTGDIATMDEDGYFYIVGRKKEMIIAGGYNIYPIEVEDVLYQHPAVAEACVFGVPDPYRGETVKAAIVRRKHSTVAEEELIQWCSERLARYKVPRLIEFREELPKTSVGKLLRRRLVEEELDQLKKEV